MVTWHFYVTWYYHKNRDKNFVRHAKYLGGEAVPSIKFYSISTIQIVYKYIIEKEVKNYNLTKEDIYMPTFTDGRKNSFRVKGGEFFFENENNISSLIKPTEDIFNTGIETSEINEQDFIDPQIEKIFKKNNRQNFLTSRFFYKTKATL